MSKKTLFVKATSDTAPCPMYPRKSRRFYQTEGGDRRDRSLIYHDEVVEVADDRFYRRRIAAGDLVEVDPSEADERLRVEGTDDDDTGGSR